MEDVMERAQESLIVALDVNNKERAEELLDCLAPHIKTFKIGLELMNEIGVPAAVEIVRARGRQVFLDGKFHDIGNTAGGAGKAVVRHKVKMFNVHCSGGIPMMEAVSEAVKVEFEKFHQTRTVSDFSFEIKKPLVLGVTVLTSMDFDDFVDLGFWVDFNHGKTGLSFDIISSQKKDRVQKLVKNLARASQKAKLDGVVCSPEEIGLVRSACGEKFIIVTPGIRPEWAMANDQKRFMTPTEAIKVGANYIVVGRPITNPPKEIGTPGEAVARILVEMAEAYLAFQG